MPGLRHFLYVNQRELPLMGCRCRHLRHDRNALSSCGKRVSAKSLQSESESILCLFEPPALGRTPGEASSAGSSKALESLSGAAMSSSGVSLLLLPAMSLFPLLGVSPLGSGCAEPGEIGLLSSGWPVRVEGPGIPSSDPFLPATATSP